MTDRVTDPRLLAAIDAAEIEAEARTREILAVVKHLQKSVRMEKEWASSPTGCLAKAVIAKSSLNAAWECIRHASYLVGEGVMQAAEERAAQTQLLRDIVGNPFRPVSFSPEWRTSTAVGIAKGMYESRNFDAMPILADALQDAGCDNADILNHCRDTSATHVRGCWVVDLVLGKSEVEPLG
jgi:hypothetical protein